MPKRRQPQSCACDSRYDGCDHLNPCGQPDDGTNRGPWCAECNPRRFASINANFAAVLESFESPAVSP